MNLEGKLEAAFKSFLSNHADLASSGLNYFVGVEDENQTLPCVVAHCMGGTEEPQNMGNYFMDVAVWIKTSLQKSDPNNPTEDRKAAHNTLVNSVRDALCIDGLAAQLSATQEGFYVFDPVINGATQNIIEGNCAKTLKQFRVYCCAADLT